MNKYEQFIYNNYVLKHNNSNKGLIISPNMMLINLISKLFELYNGKKLLLYPSDKLTKYNLKNISENYDNNEKYDIVIILFPFQTQYTIDNINTTRLIGILPYNHFNNSKYKLFDSYIYYESYIPELYEKNILTNNDIHIIGNTFLNNNVIEFIRNIIYNNNYKNILCFCGLSNDNKVNNIKSWFHIFNESITDYNIFAISTKYTHQTQRTCNKNINIVYNKTYYKYNILENFDCIIDLDTGSINNIKNFILRYFRIYNVKETSLIICNNHNINEIIDIKNTKHTMKILSDNFYKKSYTYYKKDINYKLNKMIKEDINNYIIYNTKIYNKSNTNPYIIKDYLEFKKFVNDKKINSIDEYYEACNTILFLPLTPSNIYWNDWNGWIDLFNLYDLYPKPNELKKWKKSLDIRYIDEYYTKNTINYIILDFIQKNYNSYINSQIPKIGYFKNKILQHPDAFNIFMKLIPKKNLNNNLFNNKFIVNNEIYKLKLNHTLQINYYPSFCKNYKKCRVNIKCPNCNSNLLIKFKYIKIYDYICPMHNIIDSDIIEKTFNKGQTKIEKYISTLCNSCYCFHVNGIKINISCPKCLKYCKICNKMVSNQDIPVCEECLKHIKISNNIYYYMHNNSDIKQCNCGNPYIETKYDYNIIGLTCSNNKCICCNKKTDNIVHNKHLCEKCYNKYFYNISNDNKIILKYNNIDENQMCPLHKIKCINISRPNYLLFVCKCCLCELNYYCLNQPTPKLTPSTAITSLDAALTCGVPKLKKILKEKNIETNNKTDHSSLALLCAKNFINKYDFYNYSKQFNL